jgi:MYXO-CTERM domain-containing protein
LTRCDRPRCDTRQGGATADSITLKIGNVTAVPEPSAYALALAGLGVLGVWGRRQKAQKRTAEGAAA